MKCITVVSSLLLVGLVFGEEKPTPKAIEQTLEKQLEKPSEKPYPKKVTSLKKRPTKSPNTKSIVEAFKDLPDEDLEFIKELDKQFKVHGDKIKIKVERDNSTVKNNKRTVDGDLGYGYYNGQASEGYDYPKPKFSFYPYSQHDIPASAPGYQIREEEQSTVSIIPSYSYEIKDTSSGYESNSKPFIPSQPLPADDTFQPHHGLSHGQDAYSYQSQEPVIVLKIPGPRKYASHLQVLLQQYLEARASQYLKILEEAELQKQQQHQQQFQQLQYQHHHQTQQEEIPQSYSYPQQQQQQEIAYPAIDEVYQTYKNRHPEEHPIVEPQYEEPQQQYLPASQHQPQQQQDDHGGQQQYYYMQVEQEQPSVGQGYQPIYYVAMPEPSYNHEAMYANAVPSGYVDDGHLPITENSPRHTHTKVLFTEAENNDHSTHYPLPSIKPFERHAPTSTPAYQTYQVDPRGEAERYQSQEYQSSNTEAVVSITQRPYNYHAHSSKNTKRNATPAENIRKLNDMVNRLRSNESTIPLRRTKKETL